MPGIVKFDQWQNTAGTNVGTILQVVSQTSTAHEVLNHTYSGENRGSEWLNPASFTGVSITPKFTNSRIMVFGHISLSTDSQDSYNVHYRIMRNSTEVGGGRTGSDTFGGVGYTWSAHGQYRIGPNGNFCYQSHGQPFHHVDSPQSTSSLTYKIQVCHSYGNARNVCINRGGQTSGWESGSVSTITVMEIAG